jgi:hypothetical protein
MIYVLLLVPLRGIWPLVVAWRARPAARHRQCTDAAVPALHASQPSSTELVRTPRPSISTSKMSLHEHGWLTRSSDPTRRAGDDYITSLQTHCDTHHFNQRWTISQVSVRPEGGRRRRASYRARQRARTIYLRHPLRSRQLF